MTHVKVLTAHGYKGATTLEVAKHVVGFGLLFSDFVKGYSN